MGDSPELILLVLILGAFCDYIASWQGVSSSRGRAARQPCTSRVVKNLRAEGDVGVTRTGVYPPRARVWGRAGVHPPLCGNMRAEFEECADRSAEE